MTGRTIAIGDIHGCSAALNCLLDHIKPQTNDTLITLGDYIDRGPDSLGVVERLLALPDECVHIPLLGNHEAMLLGALVSESEFYFWINSAGGRATLASYGFDVEEYPLDSGRESDSEVEATGLAGSDSAPDGVGEGTKASVAEIQTGIYQRAIKSLPASHIEFYRSCTLAYETDKNLFLHANYDATQPIDSQDEYFLLWKHLHYGTPGPHVSGKTAFVGHTPQPDGEVLDLGHLVCIDTYCFGSGWLTAIDVETKQVWQADKDGLLRET